MRPLAVMLVLAAGAWPHGAQTVSSGACAAWTSDTVTVRLFVRVRGAQHRHNVQVIVDNYTNHDVRFVNARVTLVCGGDLMASLKARLDEKKRWEETALPPGGRTVFRKTLEELPFVDVLGKHVDFAEVARYMTGKECVLYAAVDDWQWMFGQEYLSIPNVSSDPIDIPKHRAVGVGSVSEEGEVGILDNAAGDDAGNGATKGGQNSSAFQDETARKKDVPPILQLLARFEDQQPHPNERAPTRNEMSVVMYREGSATPTRKPDGTLNKEAYNCHTFAWHPGRSDPQDACPGLPLWDLSPENNKEEANVVGIGPGEPVETGDLVTYKDGKDYTCSGVVVGVDDQGRVTRVESKWGEREIFVHHPAAVPASYGTTREYYRVRGATQEAVP